MPLLCLPFAGGGNRSFESWRQLLPESVQLQTVRLPGRETRLAEPPPAGLVGLATDLASEIGPFLTGRFAVFGHSMGALLAFEFVRALRQGFGVQPSCLVVSGTRAPQRQDEAFRYANLTDAQLRTELERMGGTDAEVLRDADLWELMSSILRADLAACDAYRYQPGEPLGCPLVAYGSRDDSDLDEDSLAAWQQQTTGPFDHRMFPGGHFYFQQWPEAFAMDLVKRLTRYVLD